MSTEWTQERHEAALVALDQSMCQWCNEYAPDALAEIERLRAECQRLANETKHSAWATITEDMVERAGASLSKAGWSCCGGADEPGGYDECAECKEVCDVLARDVLAAALGGGDA